MGSIRRPSKSVVRKRRAVAVAFASALRELQASGVVARHAIADELNRQGVPTERSGRWHPTTVIRMLTRLGMVKPAAGTVGAGAASRQASLGRAQTLAPLIRQIQSAGAITQKAIAIELNARGIRASRGSKWHPTTVSRLLSRLQRPDAGPNGTGPFCGVAAHGALTGPRIDHGRQAFSSHLSLAVARPGLYACSKSTRCGGTRDCPWGAASFVGLRDSRLKGKDSAGARPDPCCRGRDVVC